MNILLHICCGNCALYPVKLFQSRDQNFTGFWFNPNIHPLEEYNSRLDSLKRLSDLWKLDITCIEDFRPQDFFSLFGLSDPEELLDGPDDAMNKASGSVPDPPQRCKACYELRLDKTAEEAKEKGFDAFTTTLLISPYQDFDQIIKTGASLSEKHDIEFYVEDFRPRFRDAMNLAREMDLYRQKYCGCVFSKIERFKKRGSKKQRHKVAE